jgi:uncharacterized protein
MTDSRFEKLTEMVKSRYDGNGDPGHDFAHIMRVIKSCHDLGQTMNANLYILLPAALLHDVVNVPKNHPDRLIASQKAAEEATGILKTIGYDNDEIEKIKVVIKEHSYSLGLKPSCIESAILQDADRLDALGAIGLMRMVTCGSRLGSSYYHLGEPIPESRELNDKHYTIDHLYVKLFKLGEQFNTEPARIEGRRRLEFMNNFVFQLQSEIRSTPESISREEPTNVRT